MDGDGESSNNEQTYCTPPNLRECAEATCKALLPSKSREKYEITYAKFVDWCTENAVKLDKISENVTIAYMTNLSKSLKPSTLWTTYSMLRSTLLVNQNIDISKFSKLRSFLKLQSTGYKTKKSNILSAEHIKRFIENAPDDKFLFTKVVLIFGISGGCRRQELKNLLIEHIQHLDKELLVKLMDTKNKTDRSFIISGSFYAICKKYMDVRHPQLKQFFQNYQNGKCVRQVAGINKIGDQPKIIARYLELPNPNSYTGHSFRRSGATLLADSGGDTLTVKNFGGWKSTAVMESYVEQSLYKKKNIGNAIVNYVATTSTLQDAHENNENRQPIQETKNLETVAEPNNIKNNNGQELSLTNNVQSEVEVNQSKRDDYESVYNNCVFNNCIFMNSK